MAAKILLASLKQVQAALADGLHDMALLKWDRCQQVPRSAQPTQTKWPYSTYTVGLLAHDGRAWWGEPDCVQQRTVCSQSGRGEPSCLLCAEAVGHTPAFAWVSKAPTACHPTCGC